MQYRKLGRSEIQVSVLGLGGNTFGPPRLDRDTSIQVIRAALDEGVTLIDTSNLYGSGRSESFIGEAITGRRNEAVIATKFNFAALDGEDPVRRIRRHCEESLSKIGTDFIDLYQVHMPSDEISTDELIETLAVLAEEGKIREYGVSNYASWRLAETQAAATRLQAPQPVSIQNQYSLLHRYPERELIQACERYGVSLIPYHPLAGGFLTGKYRKGEEPPPGTRGAAGSPIVRNMSTERNWQTVDELERFAANRGHTVTELAIAWLAAKPFVGSIIAGVSNVEQLAEFDMAVLGPLARKAEDLDLALDVLAGASHDRATAWRLELPTARATTLRGFRVAAWLDDPFCQVDSELVAIMREALDAVRAAGAVVTEGKGPVGLEETMSLYQPLLMAQSGLIERDESYDLLVEVAAEEGAAGGFASDLTVRFRDWHALDERRENSRRRWAEFFDGVDVLVCPVSPTAAFPHDQRPDPAWSVRTLQVDGEERPYREMLSWMAPSSLNHLPAAVAPIGTTRNGLPVGIQVIAPYLHDRTAVRFVRCLADAIGGFRRPPGF
ncbi:aldo/keto reductase [Rhodococcus sp. YL-1]|uniref:aldo/keto reductase n=1 Tax=Rhodococcus sp. YL-1 TaxID=1045808 RepID=UPI00096A4593|nr:aldo/keto reductase [Rhodococcus sp. YL-1]